MFRRMTFWIFSISLISNICYADDVVYLNKDDKAPFSGFEFTESKTKEMRIKLLDGEANKELNDELTKTNTWLLQNSEQKDKQLTYAMERMNSLASSLRDERTTSNWERIGYFFLGVAATSAAVYGVSKIVK